MQKFVTLVCVLFLMAFMAGCGGGGKAAATTTLPAKISLTSTDVAGRTFYSTSNNAKVIYQFNADGTVGATTEKWQISSDGAIDWTDDAGTSHIHKFFLIQKETNFWLFYDEKDSFKITRFYFNTDLAQAFLKSVAFSNVTSNGFKLGGAIQGKAIASTFSNVSTTAGSPTVTAGTVGTAGFVDGASTAARFNHPLGITTDGTNLYVADHNNNMIRKLVFVNNTWTVSKLAGTVAVLNGVITGVPGNANSTDGTGATASFNLPTGITTDGTFLYVTDTGNNTIRRVDPTSGVVTLVAGSTTSVSGAVDALNGTDARFNQPSGITTDGTNLYVADLGNHLIRKIVISSGAVVTLAGAANTPGSSDSTDGTGATARFNLPTHITTDGTNLYVSDLKNSTIRKIVIATGNVTTIAGIAGTIGSADTDTAKGIKATFNQPNGITTDGKNLYVTDSSIINNNIRMIVIEGGAVSTLKGVSGDQGTIVYVNSADGTPSFNGPAGITTDGTSLFVSDSLNNSIRKIN